MKIALAGIGKIARDQHIPAIDLSPDWELAAAVTRNGTVQGVETFSGIDEMLAARPDIDVVSLCLPPAPRFDYAVAALEAGRHVMLEKPPAVTVADAKALTALATEHGRTLFATWHSRMAPGVAPAKAWLEDKTIISAQIDWREDVRKWHPGQDWVFEPGGMGVFDPGINGLSILTEILPFAPDLQSATLTVPDNRAMPIAAELQFSHSIVAHFDWTETEGEVWTIRIVTDAGTLTLSKGGHHLDIEGDVIGADKNNASEYGALYARMHTLVESGASDVDLSPLTIVEAALSEGQTMTTDAFYF